jgi:hypothetical protein
MLANPIPRLASAGEVHGQFALHDVALLSSPEPPLCLDHALENPDVKVYRYELIILSAASQRDHRGVELPALTGCNTCHGLARDSDFRHNSMITG